MRIFLLAAAALFLASCGGEDPIPEPLPPLVADVTMGSQHFDRVEQAQYFYGYYQFMKQDCLVFHIELNNPAGMTVEIAKSLVGQRIEIANSSDFWFIYFGNGRGGYRALDNDDTDYKGYTGWFTASLGERGVCSLDFELVHDGAPLTYGHIGGPFQRLEKL